MTNPFPPVTKADWIAQVQRDLKDPAVLDNLRWLTPEGFIQEPYYTAEDITELPLAAIQATQKTEPGWLNTPLIDCVDPKVANGHLREALTQGADALLVNLATDDTNLSRLLNGIKLSDTPIFFQTSTAANTLVTDLRHIAPYQWQGGLLTDPMAQWLTQGINWQTSLIATAEATHLTLDSPRFASICANSSMFHNAGATATQELAFLLSNLAHQYDSLTDAGLPVDQLIPKTVLSVAVGTSYFPEIAKLRALRVVLQRFLSAYGVSPASYALPCIHTQTSGFYEATATPYTNLLRATTEAMAAVIGGCDALTVRPYDALFRHDDEFSARIACNVSILLREESYLGKVVDPSAGSYYIETLTHQLAEAAWTLFVELEQQGGFVKAVETGTIQTQIEEAYQAKVEAIRQGRVVVGVNKFRVDDETITRPEPKALATASFALLPDRRLASEFE